MLQDRSSEETIISSSRTRSQIIWTNKDCVPNKRNVCAIPIPFNSTLRFALSNSTRSPALPCKEGYYSLQKLHCVKTYEKTPTAKSSCFTLVLELARTFGLNWTPLQDSSQWIVRDLNKATVAAQSSNHAKIEHCTSNTMKFLLISPSKLSSR